jgi:hypothetical protein
MDGRPGDEMLLAAVAGRDMGAFRTLCERHAGWLAIRLARRCNDRDLVADADSAASVSWRTGTGRYRNVGARVRDCAGHVEPSLEDAYLLLRGGSAEDEPAGEVAS